MTTDRYRWLLVFRFVAINLAAVGLIAGAYHLGWLDQLIATDRYHLVKLNCAVFLVGLAMAGRRMWALSYELNQLDAYWPLTANGRAKNPGSRVGYYLEKINGTRCGSPEILAQAMQLPLAARLAAVRHVASTIVLIGLIGTIVGFIIALSGVDATAATDPSKIAPMIATLLLGMAIALYKTLVGSILNVWLMLNVRLLEGGTATLVARLLRQGEAIRA